MMSWYSVRLKHSWRRFAKGGDRASFRRFIVTDSNLHITKKLPTDDCFKVSASPTLLDLIHWSIWYCSCRILCFCRCCLYFNKSLQTCRWLKLYVGGCSWGLGLHFYSTGTVNKEMCPSTVVYCTCTLAVAAAAKRPTVYSSVYCT
jgi:hypothetical protein